MENCVSVIENLNKALKEARAFRQSCSAKLSVCDKQIADLQHFIEFGKYDAIDGWKILNLYKSILEERRKLKIATIALEENQITHCAERYQKQIKKDNNPNLPKYNTDIIKENFTKEKKEREDK